MSRSPFKHCGTPKPPRPGCLCIRCDQYRRNLRIRARDKYDPARNRRACARYQAKHRLAKLMYDQMRHYAKAEAA